MPGQQSETLTPHDEIRALKRRVTALEQAVLLLAGSVNSARPIGWFNELADVLKAVEADADAH